MTATTALTISFIVYTLFIIGTGLYSASRRKDTADDFILANRELGPWVSALSASASAESGWVMLGLVGVAFSNGLSAFWIMPGIGAGYLFNWFVVAERLRKTTVAQNAVTLPQFIGELFNDKGFGFRALPVIIITLAMLGYVAAQMNAAGKAFEATFSLSYHWGVIFGALIVMTYTLTGGFRAICWTDVIQAIFMVIALIFMPLIMLFDIGGFGSAISGLRGADPTLLTITGKNVGFAALGTIVGYLGIGLGYPGQPHVVARFMGAKDAESIKRGGVIAFVWFFLVYVGAIFFGMFARVYFGSLKDVEQALPIACSQLLPSVIGGFVIAAIVAAICSTADSQLMVVTTTISRDVIPYLRKKGVVSDNWARTQRLDRVVLLVLGIISVFFALTKNRVIFDFVLYAWSGLGAAFGPVVILGLLWKRITKQGAFAGMLTGAVVTYAWRQFPILKDNLYELVPAFILAFLAVVIISLLTQPRSQQ